MKSFLALTRANLVGFVRDRAAVGWTLAFPIGLIALFAILFSSQGAPEYEVNWVDEARTPASQQLRDSLERSGALTIWDTTLADASDKVRAGNAEATIHAPAGFGTDPTVPLRLLVDAADQSASGAVRALVDQALGAGNGAPAPAPIEIVPVQEDVLRPLSYLVPAIVAMALMQLGIFGAVTLVRHRERQILKRLATAPIGRVSVVASFVGSQLIVALVQTALMVAAAVTIGGADVSGNPFGILGIVVLTAASFVALGFAISGLARSEESATSITSIVTLPLLMLSGLFVPVEQLPDVLRAVANVLPLTYAADALRQVMVGAAPAAPLWLCVAVMVGWLLASLAAATRLFRWQ